MNFNQKDIMLAAAGGLLIGVATSLHYLVKGRVTGFSGIYYSLITADRQSFFWKLSLMSAVVLSSSIMFKAYGFKPIIEGASPAFDTAETLSKIGFLGSAIAGFLVGLGTKLGNGCTSGHGVCGLPRFSKRSFTAVMYFMSMGVLTATFKSFVYKETPTEVLITPPITALRDYMPFISGGAILVGLVGSILKKDLASGVIGTATGLIFGAGLVVSGMVKRSKIMGFLTLGKEWDPSLMFVMVGAVGLNLITFRLLKKPLLGPKYEVPTVTEVDEKLTTGAKIFGIGWGLGGLCPGPAVALLPEFTIQIGVIFLSTLAAGQLCANKVAAMIDRNVKAKQ